jgi:hypothetical protein
MAEIDGSGSQHSYFKTQKPIDFLDSTIVQDAWETVSSDLSEKRPAKLWYIIVEQTNNGAAAETIEFEITINGVAYTATGSLNSGTQTYVYVAYDLAAGDFIIGFTATSMTVGGGNVSGTGNRAIPFSAAKIGLVRVRQTSGVDAVAAQIEVNITWEKLVKGG